MRPNNDFLGTAPVGKLLLKLSVPTVAAQLINMLYNIVDRIFIGHLPVIGDLALTGVGVCMPLIMLVSAFAALVGSGGAPRASIAMGRRDIPAAERTLGNCLTLLVILSAILTAVLLLWGRELLLLFGASKNTIGYAADYMHVYALGTLFVQLTLGMNAYISAQGFTGTAMLSVLIGALLNIALDYVFILLLGMEVKGAALATIISQGISCLWVLGFLSSRRTVLRIRRENLRLNAKIILPCLALGLAPFIMQSSESVIMVCFNASLLRYGDDIAVGAMTILTSVMQFAMLPPQGLAQGAGPIIGYNFGARSGARVKKTFFLLLVTSLIYTTLLWAAIQLFPEVFASIFTPEAELIAFTAPALRIYTAVLFVFGIQIACQMTFVSIGNAKCSIIVAVVRKFILLLPMIYLMPALFPGDKTTAVYTAEPVSDFLAVSFTTVLFIFQFRKALRSLDAPSEN